MKRKTVIKKLCIITFIFFFEIFVFIDAEAEPVKLTSGKIIVVDINGGGDYISIQEAIDAANQGYTVVVKNGIYREILDINKPIKLLGENKNKTIINPISEKNKYAIRIRMSGVEISKFTIKNGGAGLYTTGIQISSSNIKIKNCNIYDTPVGIAIWSSNNVIDNCDFKGSTDEGLSLLGTTDSECNNNIIQNSRFHENCDGIELQYSSNNIIQNCKFYENTHSGIDAISSSNNDNLILNCEISGNKAYGVFISSSNRNIIENNIIMNNGKDIVTTGNSYDTKIKNTVTTEKLENNIKETTQKTLELETNTLQYSKDSQKNSNKIFVDNLFTIFSNLKLYEMISIMFFRF